MTDVITDDTRLPLTTPDPLAERSERLRELIPEVFVEGRVDFDRLRQALGALVDEGRERYGLSWAGKADAIRAIQAPSVGTLQPRPEESVNFDTTENVFIEEDNLRLLMEEVYGAENFVANIVWQKKYAKQNDATWLSTSHDHILLIAKNKEAWQPARLQRREDLLKGYKNPDNDPRGVGQSVVYTCNKTREERPNLYYPIKHPTTGEDIWPSPTRVWGV